VTNDVMHYGSWDPAHGQDSRPYARDVSRTEGVPVNATAPAAGGDAGRGHQETSP
jgi:hypothetical protein